MLAERIDGVMEEHMSEPSGPLDPAALRVVSAGESADDVVTRLDRHGLGDGLPLVSPTRPRVTAMLAGRAQDEPVAELVPLPYAATVEDVAQCAVLAGCAPGALPYLLAAVDAVAAPEFNLLGVSTTTGNAAVGVVVHGDGAPRHGFDTGANCLGPSRVNATFGRALALACRLLGGAVPGVLDMATLGQPAKLALCLAEGEVPQGWTSWHRSRGCAAGSDAVTVFATAGLLEVADTWSASALGLLESLASATPLPAAVSASGELVGGGQQLYVLPPEWVVRLVAEGWTRESVGAFLHEHAVLAVDRLPAAAASRLSDPARESGVLRCASSPDDFLLVCAGGTGVKAAYLPSWPGGSRAVTRPVA